MESSSTFFVERSVFKKLADNIKIRGNIIWVEGERRVGKSTACKIVLENLIIPYLRIYLTNEVQTTIKMYIEAKNDSNNFSFLPQYFNKLLQNIWSENIQDMVDLCKDIYKVLSSGTVVVIEEIQYLSSDQQVIFQQMIDRMQFESVNGKWNGGSLILMGSVPFLVEDMLYGRNSPLYERVLSRVRVYQLDSREIMSAFRQLELADNPSMMLSIHSIFGGLVGLYQKFSTKGFNASTPIEEIYNQVFASDMQSDQTQDYFTSQFGSKVTTILDAALEHKTCQKQTEVVAQKLKIDKDMAFQELQRLCNKYGLLKRVYGTTKKHSIYSYKLIHPSMLTFWYLKKRNNMSREGVTRDLDASFDGDLLKIEGFHLRRTLD